MINHYIIYELRCSSDQNGLNTKTGSKIATCPCYYQNEYMIAYRVQNLYYNVNLT